MVSLIIIVIAIIHYNERLLLIYFIFIQFMIFIYYPTPMLINMILVLDLNWSKIPCHLQDRFENIIIINALPDLCLFN